MRTIPLLNQPAFLWLLTLITLALWVTLSFHLSASTAPISGQQMALMLTLVVVTFSLMYLHSRAIPDAIKQDIAKLTQQLKLINAAETEHIELHHNHDALHQLVTEINQYLSMETDRINQEQAFSAEASHELRTPLAGMRLQAQIAQRTDNKAQQDMALSNIMLAIDRSTRLVNQLLVYSRLTKRKTLSDITQVHLGELIQESTKRFASVLAAKQVQLHIETPTSLPSLEGNKTQLLMLFDNLLQNAVDHIPDNGKLGITLSLVTAISLSNKNITHTATSPSIYVCVEDSGSGVAEEYQSLIGAPFQKTEKGKQSGAGLGLAICQRIALLHGASLVFSHSALGGLAVALQLPLEREITLYKH